MLVRIDPDDERPLYVQIVDEVKRGLVVGSLQPDDPLPSIRQLAAQLRVNFNTVKQAYRVLEHEGLAFTERGRGTFVTHVGVLRASEGREELARAVAERAFRDAYRHGLTSSELISALEQFVVDGGAEDGVA